MNSRRGLIAIIGILLFPSVWAASPVPAGELPQTDAQKERLEQWRKQREEADRKFYERLATGGDKVLEEAEVSPDIHQDKPYEPPVKVRATLGMWRTLGIRVEKVFPGPGGTTGVVASLPPGRSLTFYLEPEGGKFTIAGQIRGMPIDSLGEAGKKLKETPGIIGGNRIKVSAEYLETIPSIRQGAIDNPDVPVLYVFIDFRCKHCFRFFDVVQEVLREHPFEVRWIPIAYGGPVSETAAAWALGGKTTPEDLRELFIMSIFQQGRKDLDLLMSDKKRLVTGAITMEKTMSALKRMDIHVTPYLFRLKDGYIEAFEGGLETRMLKLWIKEG